jgi:calcineurin-like phosphoesterase family protein
MLGDITMEKTQHYQSLDRLKGVKHVILGNHDKRGHVRCLLNYVETVSGMIDYKGCAISHAPIHPNEVVFYKMNIHAHIHTAVLQDMIVPISYKPEDADTKVSTIDRYFNVDAEMINYTPISLERVLELKGKTI